MMYVNETLQSQIEDAQLEDSECFGYYYDPKARECKHCDLQQKCASVFNTRKSLGLIEDDELHEEVRKLLEEYKSIQSSTIEKKKVKVKNKPSRNKLPNTRNMTVEELWQLLEERGGTCQKFDNPVIQKAYLIKALLKTYSKE